MREMLLLRWCQISVALCGLFFIVIGSGVALPWLPPLGVLALSGALAGAIHESRLWRRGESSGAVALVLPLLGGVTGTFALLAHL